MIGQGADISPIKKEGLLRYKGGDYEGSVDSLTQYLLEKETDSEAWLFVALAEAQRIKPSNFLVKFSLVTSAMEKAKENSADEELFFNSQTQLVNVIIKSSKDTALFYSRNGDKRYEGFGGGEEQARDSIAVLIKALSFPNFGSLERIKALLVGIEISSKYIERYGDEFEEENAYFVSKLEELNSEKHLREAIKEGLDNTPPSALKRIKAISPSLMKVNIGSTLGKSKVGNNSVRTIVWFFLLLSLFGFFYLMFD